MPDDGDRADRRRAERGTTWIEKLVAAGRPSHPYLVRDGSGRMYLVEGVTARRVASGIVANGLEQALGAARDVGDHELDRFEEGVPVEVFEGPDGHAFLVIGGELRRLKGLPLPHRVDQRHTDAFPTGQPIDLPAANVSRRRLTQAMSTRYQLHRVGAAVRRRGLFGSVKVVAARTRRSWSKRSGR